MSSKICLLVVFILLLPEPSEGALFGRRRGLSRSRGGIFSLFGGRRAIGRRRVRRPSRGGNRSFNQNFNRNSSHDLLNNLGFRGINQFDSVFDPGVGLTGNPLALDGNLSVGGLNNQDVLNAISRGEPLANPNDPCGIRFSSRRNFGNSASVIGFYFDRRTGTCELGVRGSGSNPFPFISQSECESVVRSGGCQVDSDRFEANQIVFRRR